MAVLKIAVAVMKIRILFIIIILVPLIGGKGPSNFRYTCLLAPISMIKQFGVGFCAAYLGAEKVMVVTTCMEDEWSVSTLSSLAYTNSMTVL